MLVTVFGMIILVRFLQEENALPKLSTPTGIVTLVKLQPENA